MDNSELQKIKQRYNIVGNSDGLNRALDVALQVAPTDLSVLIIGESGVGKEIIPRVIHDNSPRKRERYFASTAAVSRRVPSTANSSVMKKDPSPEPSAKAKDISASPTRVPSSSMRWVNCRYRRKPDCCVCSKRVNTSVWAAPKSERLM